MAHRLLSLTLTRERDVVVARQSARQIAALVGCDAQDCTRLATAVSEVARETLEARGGGALEFRVETDDRPQRLEIVVEGRDGRSGPSAPSRPDIGAGTSSVRRLVDAFSARVVPGKGTVVTLARARPATMPLLRQSDVDTLRASLDVSVADNFFPELRQQNRELLDALQELRRRQDDLERLNTELEDTNRGVLALYAELDEQAERLRRADTMKSRFLSNMSHEFRTPLNSVLGLTRLLLDNADGDLTDEQRTQVRYIRQASEQLSEMVNDLLDLAKVEAGKIAVHPVEFSVAELFSTLRGMLRPLLGTKPVALVFDAAPDLPLLHNDESKVAQILRNLVSNAIKFTERGEIRATATLDSAGGHVHFVVTDTGIGIASEDHERIFHEFSQLENPVQKRVKGTGLGLPLSRRLAELLGGHLTVSSESGAGATFDACVPIQYQGPPAQGVREVTTLPAASVGRRTSTGSERHILIVDDEEAARYALRSHLPAGEFRVEETSRGADGLRAARAGQPSAIFLDLVMPDLTGDLVLDELRADPATREIPVVVFTSAVLDEHRAHALRDRAVAFLPKHALGEAGAAERVRTALRDAEIAVNR